MLIEIFFAIVVTYSFGLIFNVKGNLLLFSSFGGGIGWFFYLLSLKYNFAISTSYFIATTSIALYSELVARKIKVPVTTLLIAPLIPLAPGGGVYYTMFYLIQDRYQESLLKAVETFIIAGSMALGILIVSTIFRSYYTINGKVK